MQQKGLSLPVTTLLYSILALGFLFTTPNPSLSATITLQWDAANPSPQGYHVYQRLNGSSYNYSSPVWSGSKTSCSVSNLKDNTAYYFVVRSYVGSSVSSNSNEVEFTNTVSSSTGSGSSSTTTTTLDNGSASTSSTGTWKTSSGSGAFGAASLYSQTAGATYTFTSTVSGTYDVEMWWTVHSTRCSNVPVKIYNGNTLLETVYVNQKQEGGRWNFLGTYDFTGKPRVVIESENTSCTTCADAVRFVKSSSTSSSGSGSTSTSTGSSSTTADTSIIDNGGAGASSSGSWLSSGGASPYGSKSVYSQTNGATYTFTANITGNYDIDIWWTAHSTRCTNIPIRIYDGNTLLETVFANQKQEGGKWNFLGTYEFNGKARVVITSQSTSCTTCADAVRFQKTTNVVSLSNIKVIDDGGTGTSASGTWKNSSGVSPYGSKSLYSQQNGPTYTYTTSITGTYNLEMWWTAHSTRCTNVPVKVYDGTTLLRTVYANQQSKGGQWNLMGTFKFSKQARIVIESKSASCTTCADAIRLTGN